MSLVVLIGKKKKIKMNWWTIILYPVEYIILLRIVCFFPAVSFKKRNTMKREFHVWVWHAAIYQFLRYYSAVCKTWCYSYLALVLAIFQLYLDFQTYWERKAHTIIKIRELNHHSLVGVLKDLHMKCVSVDKLTKVLVGLW